MILVPVKILKNAKQRLSPVLDQHCRFALAQAMLQDVAEALANWPSRPEVAFVTSDPFALELAQEFDFEVIADDFKRSETDAIEMASSICVDRGIESTLVIPGDIPLVSGFELQQVMDAAPKEGSVLVPASDGRGTNAAYRNPAALFPLRFGNDSFKPHRAAAQATGKPCVILSLPGIGLDIDNPADLQALITAAGEGHAQRLARNWSLSDYPVAANE